MTRAALLIALGLIALSLAYLNGFRRGEGMATARERRVADAREARNTAAHALALTAANSRHRSIEVGLRKDLADQAATLTETLNREKSKHARLVADLRAGAVRLSVPVIAAPGAACAAHAGGDSAAATGDRHETRAELAPAAAADLAAIAGDGDDAVHQLNACIDAYNTMRLRLNAPRTDAQAQ